MKKFLQIILLLVMLVVAGAAMYFATRPDAPKEPQVCIKNKCYLVEIARTPAQKARGLMNRQSLESNRGMLFEFDVPGVYPFWMKNTLIPLDMVWLDDSGKIVFIYDSAQPCHQETCPNYDPKTEARYVLEINAGEMKQLGAIVGDQTIIRK